MLRLFTDFWQNVVLIFISDKQVWASVLKPLAKALFISLPTSLGCWLLLCRGPSHRRKWAFGLSGVGVGVFPSVHCFWLYWGWAFVSKLCLLIVYVYVHGCSRKMEVLSFQPWVPRTTHRLSVKSALTCRAIPLALMVCYACSFLKCESLFC